MRSDLAVEREPAQSRGRPRRRRGGGCVGSLANGLALGLALPLFALVWAQATDPIGPAPLLIAYVSLPWLLPLALVLLFGLALLTRARLTTLTAIVLLGVFIWVHGVDWLPRTPATTASGPHLRVMTFNIGDDRVSVDEVVKLVIAEQPDLLAIQELNPYSAAALNQQLAAGWPYQALDFNAPTTGIFSRLPLSGAQIVETPGNRPYLRAKIDLNGLPVEVFAMHPMAPEVVFWRNLPIGINDRRPRSQLVAAAEAMRAIPGASVMLGDFNMSDQSPGYRDVIRGLQDAFVEAGTGPGFTWPVANTRNTLSRWDMPWPLVRIDYILHSDSIEALAASVRCVSDSDHCYVVADLALRP